MLYPQSNKYRSVLNLNGVWRFSLADEDYSPASPLNEYALMPVPASCNDIGTEKRIRSHLGKVVYEREVSFPRDERMEYRVRVGAASHKCELFWNGEYIGAGESGFYPIDVPVSSIEDTNRLTIVIDNRLSYSTLPPGEINEYGEQTYTFDFYNFTGIHRDVLLYSRPAEHIEDIFIDTVCGGDYRSVKVRLLPEGLSARFSVYDKRGNCVASSLDGNLTVPEPVLWECKKPYLYKLRVETAGDLYEERFGIRKIAFDGDGLYLNDKRLYLKGFGKHEDFFISGKGNNTAVNVRDFELLRWIGANSIRTSHYPYSEEIMSLADEYGILVIDEVPGIGMNWLGSGGEARSFGKQRLYMEASALHARLVTSLIARDKNHPSVIMYSIANESATYEPESREYFTGVIRAAREATSLPIMIVEDTILLKQHSYVADMVDFIGLNRYYSWYVRHAHTECIADMLREECERWRETYGKPLILTEFGADTVEGFHALPSETFSEEYQCEMFCEYFKAIDSIPYIVGEHIWNFADFRTKEGLTRVNGNRKGVFTRERQPKSSAFTVKGRWEEKEDFADCLSKLGEEEKIR